MNCELSYYDYCVYLIVGNGLRYSISNRFNLIINGNTQLSMNLRHHELEIDSEKPFNNCKLGREPFAKILTEIVETFADGFVLAINNEWGTGKTTFVKMWRQHLSNEGFQAIYFNAWENDFNNDPLVAIMSELKALTKGKREAEKFFKSVVKKGAVLTKTVAPALVKSLVKKYVVDTAIIEDAIENITKAATEILEEEIKVFADKKESILEFRIDLEKFIESRENKKPLVFIVDELDRCRPNYSVEVLEQLKHFFSVKGIAFVLSIDKKHLASSIKGFYGSENINTDEYLRRFIDLEYSIPKPSNKLFVRYLFNYFSFSDFYNSSERNHYQELRNDAEFFVKTAELLFDKSNATLRQQEKIFALSRLSLKCFKSNQYTFSHLFFFLVYMKTMHREIYDKIENNELTPQELSDVFVDKMPLEIKNQYNLNLVYINALLLHFYNNNQEYQNRVELLTKNKEGKITTPIKISINTVGEDELAGLLENISQQFNYRDTNLKFLTSKINLIEPITVS